jgi:hypothetical protein
MTLSISIKNMTPTIYKLCLTIKHVTISIATLIAIKNVTPSITIKRGTQHKNTWYYKKVTLSITALRAKCCGAV